MMIVKLENIVRSILMEDQNVKMFVAEDFYVAEIQNALLEITTLNVNVNKVFILTERFAERLNANQTMTVAMISDVTATCAKLYVSWVNHVEKMHCAQLKTINKFVSVNRVTQEILKRFVVSLISVKVHHVHQELRVETIEVHINVRVNKDLLEILTMLVAHVPMSVDSTMIAQKQLNAFKKMAFQNAKMYAKV